MLSPDTAVTVPLTLCSEKAPPILCLSGGGPPVADASCPHANGRLTVAASSSADARKANFMSKFSILRLNWREPARISRWTPIWRIDAEKAMEDAAETLHRSEGSKNCV